MKEEISGSWLVFTYVYNWDTDYFENQLSTVEVLSHFGNYNDILQLAEIVNVVKNGALKK